MAQICEIIINEDQRFVGKDKLFNAIIESWNKMQ